MTSCFAFRFVVGILTLAINRSKSLRPALPTLVDHQSVATEHRRPNGLDVHDSRRVAFGAMSQPHGNIGSWWCWSWFLTHGDFLASAGALSSQSPIEGRDARGDDSNIEQPKHFDCSILLMLTEN